MLLNGETVRISFESMSSEVKYLQEEGHHPKPNKVSLVTDSSNEAVQFQEAQQKIAFLRQRKMEIIQKFNQHALKLEEKQNGQLDHPDSREKG